MPTHCASVHARWSLLLCAMLVAILLTMAPGTAARLLRESGKCRKSCRVARDMHACLQCSRVSGITAP